MIYDLSVFAYKLESYGNNTTNLCEGLNVGIRVQPFFPTGS